MASVFAKKRALPLSDWNIGIRQDDGQVYSLVVQRSGDIEDIERGTADYMIGYEDILLLAGRNEVDRQSADPRREKSLLRIIRALDVMAGLPDRGAASSVELQLQKMGFSGPNDETIRGILKEARALKPEKSQ